MVHFATRLGVVQQRRPEGPSAVKTPVPAANFQSAAKAVENAAHGPLVVEARLAQIEVKLDHLIKRVEVFARLVAGLTAGLEEEKRKRREEIVEEEKEKLRRGRKPKWAEGEEPWVKAGMTKAAFYRLTKYERQQHERR